MLACVGRRGPKDHIKIRILQTTNYGFGILFALGLSSRMLDPYVYVVFGA